MNALAIAPAPKPRIAYRERRPWKYRLEEDFWCDQNRILYYHVWIDGPVTVNGQTERVRIIELLPSGRITIRAGYCWDGPSGPTIDTPAFMRGSLVHDALYQLMREEKLPQEHREPADLLLHDHCIEDGMSRARAWYVLKGVQWFGGQFTKPDLQRAP